MSSIGRDSYVGTLHYKKLVPAISAGTLQEVCDQGNTTNTNINITAGTLKTDKIDADSTGIVAFQSPFRGLKQTNDLALSIAIDPDFCRGDMVVLSPLAPATFTLPEGEIGMHLTLVNTSTQTPRIAVVAGDTIDGLATFVAFPAGSAAAPFSPFVWNVVCPRNNNWVTSKPV